MNRLTLTKGDVVLTHTTSGELIRCTVIERDDLTGEWLLNSPSHGYAIQRSSREVTPFTQWVEEAMRRA